MRLDNFWMPFGLCVGLVGSLVAGHLPAASAQSDPAGFTTVINAPPTLIGNDQTIGSNVQLNVFDDEDVRFEVGSGFDLGSFSGTTNIELNLFSGGGINFEFSARDGSVTNVFGGIIGPRPNASSGSVVNIMGGNVGSGFDANFGSVVNISGGSVGIVFDANSGSVVNVSGGSLGRGFEAFSGSEVNVSGGTFGGDFNALAGSNVTFIGGEFLLNGEAPADPASVTLSESDVLTGTLEDGTVFVFSPLSTVVRGDDLTGVTLQSGTLPANNVLPFVVFTEDGLTLNGVRSGQTLILEDGGELREEFSAVDANLDIRGGTVGPNLHLSDTVADISGGTLGLRGSFFGGFFAYSGSTVNISGDALIDGLSLALSGSEVNISGGTTDTVRANAGSVVNVSNGSVRGIDAATGSLVTISGGALEDLEAFAGSVVTISGGTFTDFDAFLDSDVTIRGGEFLLNGIALANPATVTLNESDVLTGTLQDGSVFVFSRLPSNITSSHELQGVAFETVALTAADLTPIVVDDALDVAPTGLRAGQSLTLRGDGALGSDFVSVGAALNIEGGSVDDSEVVSSTVTISEGEVARLAALLGSAISLSGGQVDFLSLSQSSAEISGGSLGGLIVGSGSEVELTGGTLGEFTVNDGGTLNVRGGTITGNVGVRSGGELNLFVTEAFIDDVPISDLVPGEPRTILERDVTLSGLLADGSEFSFSPTFFNVFALTGGLLIDPFNESATVTVTLASPVLLGDVNRDGIVDFFDISPFIEVLSNGVFQAEADCNQDGEVNFFDIASWIAILTAG